MSPSHQDALRQFRHRLSGLLVLRGAVQAVTVWFFIWGVAILTARFFGTPRGTAWLAWGLLGALPLIAAAAIHVRKGLPDFTLLRARYDETNRCGGVLMSQEVADMSAWQAQLPTPRVPEINWQGGRFFLRLAAAAGFVAVTLLLPESLAKPGARQRLEIGQIVQDLKTEVKALEQEKIFDEKKAADLQQQLSQLQTDANANDSSKTWEALDHIKQDDTEKSREAAEEAQQKLEKLSQAETLASAMQMAADEGMNPEMATRAAQDLATLVASAKLQDGVLKGEIPPSLLDKLNGLDRQQMEDLLKSLQLNSDALTNAVDKLADLKLIDPAKLAQCHKAGEKHDPGALAQYLSTCTNASDSLCQLALCYGRGGVSRGPGAAPMTWKDESDPDGAKFQEQALPAASELSGAQLVGLSRSAPEVKGGEIAALHGALAGAATGGGSAQSQTVLPQHKQAVRNYFKRNDPGN